MNDYLLSYFAAHRSTYVLAAIVVEV